MFVVRDPTSQSRSPMGVFASAWPMLRRSPRAGGSRTCRTCRRTGCRATAPTARSSVLVSLYQLPELAVDQVADAADVRQVRVDVRVVLDVVALDPHARHAGGRGTGHDRERDDDEATPGATTSRCENSLEQPPCFERATKSTKQTSPPVRMAGALPRGLVRSPTSFRKFFIDCVLARQRLHRLRAGGAHEEVAKTSGSHPRSLAHARRESRESHESLSSRICHPGARAGPTPEAYRGLAHPIN